MDDHWKPGMSSLGFVACTEYSTTVKHVESGRAL